MHINMLWKILILAILNVNLVYCTNSVKNKERINWKVLMEKAEWGTKKLTEILEPYILENFPFGNVSKACTKSAIMYAKGLEKWEPWAIKMFDATGKFPSSFLSGTTADFGSYDDCLAIRMKSTDSSNLFKGRFCLMSLKYPLFTSMYKRTSDGKSYLESYGYPPDWVAEVFENYGFLLDNWGLHLGICVPSTCTERDLLTILSSFSKPANATVSLSDCQVDEPRKWPVSAIAGVSVVLGLIIVCLLGTTLDSFDRKKIYETNTLANENVKLKILKAFSLYTNGEKLFRIQEKKTPIDCFHGIRITLCMLFLLCHIFMFPGRWHTITYTNYYTIFKIRSFLTVFIENGMLFLENFFVLSGFLMTYMFQMHLNSSRRTGGNKKITSILWQRYWRMTPAHAFTIMLTFTIPVLYNGPIWNSTWEEHLGRCRAFGWINLFYIQNFLVYHNLCWLHTWYLGALFQIHIVSLFLMIVTYKYPKIGITAGIVMIFGCLVLDFKALLSIKPIFTTYFPELERNDLYKYSSEVYQKPFSHFPSHTVGMVLGWIALKNKDKKIPKVYYVMGWLLSIGVQALLLFAVWFPTRNITLIALYYTTRNLFWSISFSWLVYVCTTGSGGIVEKLLSIKALVPFSEVSFLVYLLHPLIIVARSASFKQRNYMELIPQLIEFLALTVAVFVLAFIVHFLVEAPFNRIYDMWQKEGFSSTSKASSVVEVNPHITEDQKHRADGDFKKTS